MYFKRSHLGTALPIDGDKQFCLIMGWVREQLKELKLEDLSHCLVNTAYTNSRANQYLDKMNVNHVVVPTGVKNAHPEVQKYVIGANDEPNGHGTIVVKWNKLNEALEGKENELAAKKLVSFLKLSNPYVGDAICNLLMIEAVLRDRDFSLDFFNAVYKENPNKMYKVVVRDRTKWKTTWDETRLLEPSMFQGYIDYYVQNREECRAFARPSGTEDILRLYVEAADEANVN